MDDQDVPALAQNMGRVRQQHFRRFALEEVEQQDCVHATFGQAESFVHHVELLVCQRRLSLRDDFDLDLAQRVYEPVATFAPVPLSQETLT